MNRYLAYYFIQLISFIPISAQEKKQPDIDFSNEPSVYNYVKEKVNISVVNGKIKIESYIELEKQIQIDKNDYSSNFYINYNSIIKVEDIKAKLLIPDGKKTKSYPPANIVQEDNFNENTFFDDNKLYCIIFPQTPKNSRIQISYKEIYDNPYFFGSFFFSSYIPILFSEYSVTFPDEIKLKYKLYNTENCNIIFTESKKKNMTTYTWVARKVFIDSRNYPDSKNFNASYYSPHILLTIKSLNNIPFFDDYRDQYKYYVDLLKYPSTTCDPVFKDIADSLCGDLKTEAEKVDAIYNFVQSKIKYVAIEVGMGGIIPENPLKVYKSKYGDCKGKSNLLLTLLQQAGIKAWLTWVGSRHIPYKFSEFSTMYNDNHMIVTCQIGDNFFFLDPTETFLFYEFPSSFTQGKEALVGIDSNQCKLIDIPVVSFEKNTRMERLTLAVFNDTLKCTGTSFLTGYYKYDLASQMLAHNEQKNEDICKLWFLKDQAKGTIANITTSDMRNRIDTLKVNYSLSIPGYVTKVENHLYINMILDRSLLKEYLDSTKYVYDRFYYYAFNKKYTYILNIPENYTVESLPPDTKVIFKNFGFSISYHHNGNSIIMEELIYVKNPYVRKNEFNDWNDLIMVVRKIYNQTISLKLKSDESKN